MSALKSEALREFEDAAKTLMNPALQEFKEKGGKVIGFMYHFIPEEIVTAAGMMPYRMRATGSEGTELSEGYFTQVNCSLVRHFFDSGMRGRMSFLDGVVSANNCDHIRRLYDNWQWKVKTPYMHFMVFPKKTGKEQVEAYREQLADFRESLEKAFNVKITDEKLHDAIRLHNETRRLQRELYALRKGDAPPITGTQTLAAMVAGTCIPRDRYNALLKQLIKDCSAAKGGNGYKARIVVMGGEIDEPKFVEIIEGQGGLVVGDALGYGSRSIVADVDETGDPLTALSRYQLVDRPADPRIFGTSFDRNDYVVKQVREYKADGVVSVRLIACDLYGFEQVNLSKHLKRNGIPHLGLEIEYVIDAAGQMKTRVQAFLESIAEAKHDRN
jgi:benzoyl-CoA reductase/2-hydroxyglutaryl-CoA dehydratase subunit BcrC/BadD/HgdB